MVLLRVGPLHRSTANASVSALQSSALLLPNGVVIELHCSQPAVFIYLFIFRMAGSGAWGHDPSGLWLSVQGRRGLSERDTAGLSTLTRFIDVDSLISAGVRLRLQARYEMLKVQIQLQCLECRNQSGSSLSVIWSPYLFWTQTESKHHSSAEKHKYRKSNLKWSDPDLLINYT